MAHATAWTNDTGIGTNKAWFTLEFSSPITIAEGDRLMFAIKLYHTGQKIHIWGDSSTNIDGLNYEYLYNSTWTDGGTYGWHIKLENTSSGGGSGGGSSEGDEPLDDGSSFNPEVLQILQIGVPR